MGNPEYSYDILPDESFDVYISDISQRFSFDPLSKIICADQQVLFVSKCFKERTYNIQTPLRKRPRAGKRIKNSSRLVNIWSESLTLVTFFNIFLRFFLHAYPPISLRNGPGGIGIFPPVWLPQIPSCSSSRSDSDISRCTQSRYGPENEHLYNLLSLDNQNRGAFLRIFSASSFSSGNISLSRNNSIGSIQLGPKLT